MSVVLADGEGVREDQSLMWALVLSVVILV